MIVKNETAVLDRLFRSVRHFIDYYVIVDTGSTDGTPEFIRRWMSDAHIEGEVHSREWVNFGVNRNQALKLAVASGRADWLLFIDADEELGCSNTEFYRDLVPGTSYLIEKHLRQYRYALPHLLDIRENTWEWRGPAHNYLVHLDGPDRRERRDDVWIIVHVGEGAKSHSVSQREKYLRDARLFEAELAANPGDARSQFYLAQSYRDAGEPLKAKEEYARRAAMGGWAEEAWHALYQIAALEAAVGADPDVVIAAHLKAFEYRPRRAEPLCDLARYLRRQRRYALAYLFASRAVAIPRPDDALFISEDVYAYRTLDEFAIAAYWIGEYAASAKACEQLLASPRTPAGDRPRIEQNLQFANNKIHLSTNVGGSEPPKALMADAERQHD